MAVELAGSSVLSLLRKELDVTALRQRVIANNIANVNTPNFKKSVVRFEEFLQNALTNGDGFRATALLPDQATGLPEPVVEREASTSMRADGNNVDVDQEMTSLAVNTILYQTAAQELNERLMLLSYVITGRR